jgi:WD40 repeat protein
MNPVPHPIDPLTARLLVELKHSSPLIGCRFDPSHSGWVRAVAASPDGQTIASSGNDHLVKLWTADGRLLKTLEGHTSHLASPYP